MQVVANSNYCDFPRASCSVCQFPGLLRTYCRVTAPAPLPRVYRPTVYSVYTAIQPSTGLTSFLHMTSIMVRDISFGTDLGIDPNPEA